MNIKDIKIGSNVRVIGTERPVFTICSKTQNLGLDMWNIVSEDGPITMSNFVSVLDLVSNYELVGESNNAQPLKDLSVAASEDEDIVTNVEQSRVLAKIGVDVSTSDYYWWYAEGEYYLYKGHETDVNAIPAWSENALMSIIPKYVEYNGSRYDFDIKYSVNYCNEHHIFLNGNRSSNLKNCLFNTFLDIQNYIAEHKFKVGNRITPKPQSTNYSRFADEIFIVEKVKISVYVASTHGITIEIPFADEDKFDLITSDTTTN